jgi:hypothetical protein
VIVTANDERTLNLARQILLDEAGVRATEDLRAMMWVNEHNFEIEWVVGYDGFLGKVCQMHVVKTAHKPAPRKMLWAAFDYPFNRAGIEMILGVVNSNNEYAMNFDKHLGFKELNRLPGMHDDGGDLVLFGMKKDECKWLKEKKYEAELVAA